jgi:hypothetical protein
VGEGTSFEVKIPDIWLIEKECWEENRGTVYLSAFIF